MEKYFYSKGWSFVKKKSWGEFSVEDALRRHGKEEYTVLINSSSRPDSYNCYWERLCHCVLFR